MSFSSCFSVQYLTVLLPCTAVLYAVTPQKIRRLVLLAASWIFFWALSGRLIVYLLFSIFAVYCFGLRLSVLQRNLDACLEQADRTERKRIRRAGERRRHRLLLLAAAVHIGMLVFLKYSGFAVVNLSQAASFFGLQWRIEPPSFLLPAGISFYTLQAVSYLADVAGRRIPADRNLLRIALFMSFFPEIMEGPIVRYGDTALRLWEAPRMRYENFQRGVLRILYGVMKKMVIADRLNLLIRTVFGGYMNFGGGMILTAAVCYTVQLYMDFSGTMDVALGSAELFGIRLPENFRRPFFSKSIQEFWQRWHITLGTWFRDYVFFPVSMSGAVRKAAGRAGRFFGRRAAVLCTAGAALAAVWLANGFWHGAGWQYLFFGMYHFVLIFAGMAAEPAAERLAAVLRIRRDSMPYRAVRTVRTALLVVGGELFFRAEGLRAGMVMMRKIMTDFSLAPFRDGTVFRTGMDAADFGIVLAVLAVIFMISLLQEKGLSVRDRILHAPAGVRIGVLCLLVMTTVIFGAYGAGYVPVDPIYAGF